MTAPPSRRRSLAYRLTATVFVALVLFACLLVAVERLLGDRSAAIGFALAVLFVMGASYVFWTLVTRWVTAPLIRLSRGEANPLPASGEADDEIALLARSVSALHHQVQQQAKSYALKDIRRREWIAQVSHDLRTPLTAQAACLERAAAILEDQNAPMPRKQLAEILSVAKMDGDRVHTLADDLLEIARLDAGDRLQVEPVPPGELVRQAVRVLDPLASKRELTIRVEVTPRLPVLQADGRRLMRAIENLLRNAIQHANHEVHVLAVRSGNNVRFEVRDDGAGLPKDTEFLDSLRRRTSAVRLSELAKRRSRADSAGLGLIVAQRVAEAHGGTVDAYNLSRGGAAFLIDLPVPPD